MSQDSINIVQSHSRKWVLGTVQVGLWGSSFYALDKSWYSNQQRTKFHLYNDWGEWQQMDKLGHAWSSYQIAEHTSTIWRWTGMKQSKAIWIGSLSSMAYLSVIEILDGYAEKWGFSIPDVMANATGVALFLSQELLWKEQRIRLKMSYSPLSYGNMNQRANELFGKSDLEKLLKDYNGQTYWTSINLRSFFPDSRIPGWLNIAVGYGARTMLGGYENTWIDSGVTMIDRRDIQRYRRMYLSIDFDLTKIKTEKKALKTIFSLLNVLKIPAPALELNSLGKPKFHPVFF